MGNIKDINNKIESAVVNSYNKIEDTVARSYQKIEDKFVDTFLRNDDETIEEAKARVKKEQEKLESQNNSASAAIKLSKEINEKYVK